MAESKKTRDADAAMRAAGFMVEPIVGSKMNTRGRPDRWVTHTWLNCSGLWLEYKEGGISLREDQAYWHYECLRRGGMVFIARFIKGGYLAYSLFGMPQKGKPPQLKRARAKELPLGWLSVSSGDEYGMEILETLKGCVRIFRDMGNTSQVK